MEEISSTYYVWVARDKYGKLILFNSKPFRWKWFGEWGGKRLGCLNPKDFPDVTWESGAVKVELTLKMKQN